MKKDETKNINANPTNDSSIESKNIKKRNAKDFVEYVNSHAAGLTLISTLSFTVGGGIINFVINLFAYLYDFGQSMWYQFPINYIDISRTNLTYNFFLYGAIAFLFIILNIIFYDLIWKKEKRILILKIILHIGFLVIFDAVTTGIILLCFILNNIFVDFESAIHYLIVLSLLLAAIFIPSFSIGIGKTFTFKNKTQTNQKNLDNHSDKNTDTRKLAKYTVIAFILGFALIILYGVYIGIYSASRQSDFIVVEQSQSENITEGYVVLYETADSYIVTKCQIDNNKHTIEFCDINIQKEIDKKDIEYTIFRDINRIK